MNTKLTLEDLKLESFLTEIDNSKLVKVQGGNGAYGDYSEDGDCDTGEQNCDTTGGSDYCPTQDGDACQTLNSQDCDGGSGPVQC